MKFSERYQTSLVDGEKRTKRSVFACAPMFLPERMAGQTACPEKSLARARKGWDAVRTGRRNDFEVDVCFGETVGSHTDVQKVRNEDSDGVRGSLGS